MTLNLSTGFIKAWLGREAKVVGDYLADLTFATGSGSDNDTIKSAAADFSTLGFEVGMELLFLDCDPVGNEDLSTILRKISTDGGTNNVLEVANGVVSAGGAGSGHAAIVGMGRGGSVKDIMKDFTIHIYDGSKPANADQGETGTLLAKISKSGVDFTAGLPDNGLEWGSVSGDMASGFKLSKNTDTWQDLLAIVAGNAGWFRAYDNNYITGPSTTAVRFDGICGVESGDLQLATLQLKTTVPVIISSADYKLSNPS
jgi:hypothetical protein